MLRLSLAIAIMKQVSNSSGVSFSTLMLDECLDGFDEETKLKGFTLLEKLATEYENVFVIDHNEAVKTQFINRIDVELVNGKSVIGKT
jgi:DNA repair exonuclease SbcCD ATPase subunit